MKGDKGYDDETVKKKEAYKKLYMDLIPVYPETIKKDLKSYLLKSISRIINENRKNFDNQHKI